MRPNNKFGLNEHVHGRLWKMQAHVHPTSTGLNMVIVNFEVKKHRCVHTVVIKEFST